LAPALLIILLPVLAELGLRLFGFGYPTAFVVRRGEYWFPNEKFAHQFFGPHGTSRPVYFRLPVQKPPDTFRIVLLGESAAMGTPDPAFSFGRILEVMLEQRFRGQKIELVNAAMRGIDSHVVRHIARDCARLKPDLFIVYMGNNEVIGLHGPEPGCSKISQSLWVIRAGQFLKSTRLGQLFKLGRRSSSRATTQDMEFFRKHRLQPDDWRREAVRRNFAANLADICRAGANAGARVIVSTVPVNIKDFPPLGSLDGQAEEQFRLGQKFLAAGETNQARQQYERSLDSDALQFRADTLLNQRIRDVATRFPSNQVTLVDALAAFAGADDGIPGATLFRDHVHPTFEGDYLLARTLLPAVEHVRPLSGAAGDVPSREHCAKLLAYTEWHAAQIQLAMADLTSRPPYHDQLDYRERQANAEKLARGRVAKLGAPEIEAALQISLAAVNRRPDDWMLRNNCAQLYQALARPAGAIEHLEVITKIFPDAASFQMLLGQALAGAGRLDAAIFHFEQAVKLDPDDERARDGLLQLRRHKAKLVPP
jgi:tetratricopeptide (TPR) repeat protein